MRIVAAALALSVALSLYACTPSPNERAPEAQVSQDALLLAASEASTRTPVEIEGYVFMFKREKVEASGTIRQNFAEIVVTKSGTVLREKPDDFMYGAIDGKFLEKPIVRVQPELDAERKARLQAQELAIESDTGTVKYGAIEPYIRRYLIKDADGNLYYIAPDGSGYSPAPVLVGL